MQNASYRIGEIANFLGISKEMIRHYEKCGVIHPQRQEESNYRTYSSMDVFMLCEMLQLKEWNISIKDIAKIKSSQYTESLLDCYQKEEERLEEETAFAQVRLFRLRNLIDQIETCRMNVGNYWIEKRHAGIWFRMMEGKGDSYSALIMPAEIRKKLIQPRVIPFFDTILFLQEDSSTLWGQFIDERYTVPLHLSEADADKKMPEMYCLCTIIDMGEPGDFREEKFAPALSMISEKGLRQTGPLMALSIARGFEEQKFCRYLKVQIPAEKIEPEEG